MKWWEYLLAVLPFVFILYGLWVDLTNPYPEHLPPPLQMSDAERHRILYGADPLG